MKPILDACCGSRMFWFDKTNKNVVFMDNRKEEKQLCDGRILKITPDIVADFRSMPFADNTFYLVVFDPPHLIRAGKKSWLAAKYGKLDEKMWRHDLRQGFKECMRVLKPHGTLVFKWNEEQISVGECVLNFGQTPLFGFRRGKTHFLVYMKLEDVK